jgi:hypothetical protein
MPLELPLNSANEKLPPVTEELIVWLRNVFPDRMPDVSDDLTDIRYKQGQVAVVKTLTSIHNELRSN